MKTEVRYNDRKLVIHIEPSESSERALFDILRDKGIKPTLKKQGEAVYPYIEIEIDLYGR